MPPSTGHTSIHPSFWKQKKQSALRHSAFPMHNPPHTNMENEKSRWPLRHTCFFLSFRPAAASDSGLLFRQPADSSRFPDSGSCPGSGRFAFLVPSFIRRRLLSRARHSDIQSESFQWRSHAPLRRFHLYPTRQTPGHGKYTPSAETKKAGVVATHLL
jgi:hypothetical protein